jgi:hypothetical protein
MTSGTGAAAQDVAGGIEDTDLDSVLGGVEANEEWYGGWQVGLLQMGWLFLGYFMIPPARSRREQPGIIPI